MTNTGSLGQNCCRVILQNLIASVAPDSKKLIRFQKIELESKETKTVQFIISKEDLGFVNAKNEWIVEPGSFRFLIGTDPNDLLETEMDYRLN